MWKVGNPLEQGTMVGPIINKIQFEKVLKYI
jgi:acyl-CoA reductase-like NAD-dependent aldehyde dehydrogenase